MLNTLCPICKQPLKKDCNSAVCPNGHLFDYAKEGYLYLLKPNDKHSQDPGDNKEMVNARRNFLNGDYYAPLANGIIDIINDHYLNTPILLIDAGVGTGYYLNKIISSRNSGKEVYLGADISKHAVKVASKVNKRAECAVASVYDLPYNSDIADVITCVFSPYAYKEYARLLKNSGILIIACPREEHLIELRKALYDEVKEVDSTLDCEGFKIIEDREIKYNFNLKSNIKDLLSMTPYAYRAPKDKIEMLKNTQNINLTAHFHLYVLKKA